MVDHPRESARPAARGQVPESPGASGEAPGDGDRVAKALARAGVASRREVERLIEAGRVSLNGQVLTTPAVKVGKHDILMLDGKPVEAAEPARVWRYHKPAGLMTSHNDPQGRPTVFAHLPADMPRVISVGRLDLNTEGLLLLTNDGELARSLELPKNALVRRYRARAFGRVDPAKLEGLKNGVTIEGVAYGPIEARIDKAQGEDRKTGSANLWISVAITEGKNREVRRVLEHLGLKVNRLIRLAYGPFALADLAQGEVQEVGPRVIREQLAAFVPAQNLPKGERAAPGPVSRAAGPSPGRRPRAKASAEGAAPAASAKAAPAAPEKMAYKAGWAKPKKKAGPPPSAKARKPSRPAGAPASASTSAPTSAKPAAGSVISRERVSGPAAKGRTRPGQAPKPGHGPKPGQGPGRGPGAGGGAGAGRPGGRPQRGR
jgi:23S rRNA pseudouridine2605 synthase